MAYELKGSLEIQDRFSKVFQKAEKAFDRMMKSNDALDKAWNQTTKSSRTTSKTFDGVGTSATKAFDRATAAAGRYRDASGRLREANGRFAAESTTGFATMSGALGGATGGVVGLNGAFMTLVGTIATAVGGAKLLEATIGEAAKFEASRVLIEAMFDDKAASDSYLKMVEQVAAESPLLNSQDMFSNSKSFISLSKDAETLEKAWGTVEKLNVLDPIQGVEGAVLAMRELAGGDVVSLVERFELPRKELNELKGLSFEEQIAGIDALLASMNMTDEVVEKMGNTTIAKWNQIKEKSAIIFRQMGESANSEIGKALGKFNEFMDSGAFDKLAVIGDQVLGKTFSGLISGVEMAINGFTRLQQSPAVMWMQTTLPGVFNTVKSALISAFGPDSAIGSGVISFFQSIMSVGQQVWDFFVLMGPGVKQVFTDLWIIVQPILGALGTALRIVGDVANTVFSTIVMPVLRLAWAAFQTLWTIVSPILKILGTTIRMTFAILEQTWNAVIKPVLQFIGDKFTQTYNTVKPVLDGIKSGFDFVNDAASALIGKVESVASALGKIKAPSWFNKAAGWVGDNLLGGALPGFATGLERVPQDMPAVVHKDESILTAAQSDTLRNMGVLKSNGSKPVLNTAPLTQTRYKVSKTSAASSTGVKIDKVDITINGAQKTTKEMARELVTELKYTISAGALAGVQ